jgi:RNA polymerase sigma-70 factor, ECF subfamily
MRAETPVTDQAPLARPQAVPDPAVDAAEQEAALARQVRDGDPAALRTAHERHGRVVVTLALRALAARHNAEDVTQQEFLRAWRARTALDPARGVVGGRLIGATRRQIADRLAAPAR